MSKSYGESTRTAPPEASLVDGIVCASTVTHARPPAMVIACGLPPTAIVAIGWLVAGSIRVTVPSPLLATHTEPAPTDTPVGERPTAIVSVTALVPGSIRTTLSAPLTATQTPPPPTAIPLGPGPTASGVTRPVALSTRITLPAKLSVIHAASAPTSIPPGAALGSTCSTMRPVCAASRVNSPECGATQTWSFRAATAPGLPGTTVPIETFWPIRSNCGSMRRAETEVAVALETTTHTPPAAAAIPVGGPPAGIAPQRAQASWGPRARSSDRRGLRPTATPTRTRSRPVACRPRPAPRRGWYRCRSRPASWAPPARCCSCQSPPVSPPLRSAPRAAPLHRQRSRAHRAAPDERSRSAFERYPGPATSSAGSWAKIARSSS